MNFSGKSLIEDDQAVVPGIYFNTFIQLVVHTSLWWLYSWVYYIIFAFVIQILCIFNYI